MPSIIVIVATLVICIASVGLYFASIRAYRAHQQKAEAEEEQRQRKRREDVISLSLAKEPLKAPEEKESVATSDTEAACSKCYIQEHSEFSSRLPLDIKLAILTHAASTSPDSSIILTMALVCKEWKHIIDTEELFWRGVVLSHSGQWEALQQRAMPLTAPPPTWRDRCTNYHKASFPNPNVFHRGGSQQEQEQEQAQQVSRLAVRENPWPEPRQGWLWALGRALRFNHFNRINNSNPNINNNNNNSNVVSSAEGDEIPRGDFNMLAVMGAGVADVVYRLIQQSPAECPFVQTGMYSGSLAIGSPVGVMLNGKETLVCGMRDPQNTSSSSAAAAAVAASHNLEALWAARRRYLARADGLVFALGERDLSGNGDNAEDLVVAINEAVVHCPNRPVLILYRRREGMSGLDVAEKLRLLSLWGRGFTWRLQPYDPVSLKELPYGFVWLVEENNFVLSMSDNSQ